MSAPISYGLMDNPIGETTGRLDHEKIAVVVDAGHRYNGCLVQNHVRIIQLDQDDIELLYDHAHGAVDPSEFTGTEIVTDAAGARKLAALLIASADKAEQVPA